KTLAASTAALGCTALVSLLVGTMLLARANARTKAQWERAEENLGKAQRAEATAKAINKFLTDDLLAAARPEAKGRELTIHQALDEAVPKLDKAFADQPEVEASVRLTVGITYRSLGLHSQAEPHLRKALELRRDLLGAEHPDTLTAAGELAHLLF